MLEQYLPFFTKLTPQQQAVLSQNTTRHTAKKGEIVHNGSLDCIGILILVRGQFRVFTLSEGAGKSRSTAFGSGISACFRHPA